MQVTLCDVTLQKITSFHSSQKIQTEGEKSGMQGRGFMYYQKLMNCDFLCSLISTGLDLELFMTLPDCMFSIHCIEKVVEKNRNS